MPDNPSPNASRPAADKGLWAAVRDSLRAIWVALHSIEPHFWENLQSELSAGRQWLDRGIVLGHAVATGLLVVGMTLLSEAGSHLYARLSSWSAFGPFIPLLFTPLVTMGLMWWMRRFAPGAFGSGIPQVIRALDDELHPAQVSWLVSLRMSLHKVGLVAGGLLAGLSIGREGPAVQVGAGMMSHAQRWLSPRSAIDGHDLMVAGAAAGIAAAFNTPLGGVIFALEELSRRRSMSHSAMVISSIVISGLVAVAVFGNQTYFGTLRVQQLSIDLLVPGLVIAMAAGLGGGLFARLIVVSIRGLPDRFSRWRREHPVRFAGGCGLAVAVIGLVTGGATVGAGYAPTRALLEGHGDLPGVYTLLKFCATWLSSWSGVPAGIFAPALAVGAGIGHDVALLSGLGKEAAIPLIALGMVGFLAAVTQAPMTSFIIVMEMVSGHAMVLSLMACALLATGISRLLTGSIYHELAAIIALPPRPETKAIESKPPST